MQPLRVLRYKKPVLAGVIALIATGILLYALPLRHGRGTSTGLHRSELQELVTAVGRQRTFEPRVTGNFAYADLAVPSPTRSGTRATGEAPLNMRVAAIALEKRAQGSTDPVALNAFGIAQLMTGETARAVSTLEEANRLAPKDARLSSDLAAGYLVRARETNQIEDVARAVGFAQHAAEIDPRLAEAQFNLALSLEGLSLRHEAGKAWQAYVNLDPSSPWASEAKRRIERLAETPEARWEKQRREIIAAGERGDDASVRAATQRFPDTAYEYVENDLIPGWADAWLARDVEKANRNVRLARAFGQALADGVGDRMPLDATVAIERASVSRERADSLARGHQVFREGRKLYEQNRVAESEKRFAEAQRHFFEEQSPFGEWATLQLAIGHYYRGDFEQATALLDDLGLNASTTSHLRVLGRTDWMKGLTHYVRGQVADSLDSYRKALVTFERVGAVVDQAAMHSSIAENLEAVGDLRTASTHTREALARLGIVQIASRRETILDTSARMAKRRNLLGAATFFQTEFVSTARQAGRSINVVEGYLRRAELHDLAGEMDPAAQDVQEAERWLERITDESLAKRARAEVMLAKGQTLQRTDPVASIETLRASLDYFRKARLALRLPRINLAIGRAQMLAHQPRAAEATFLEGIQQLESQRARVAGGQLRLGYFDQPWNLFDEMIRLQADDADFRAALMFAERYRARDLVETASGIERAPLVNPATLAERMSTNAAMIYYVSLDDRLLAWVVRSRRVEFFQQAVRSTVLDDEVTKYVAALQSGVREDVGRLGARMYERLIRQLRPSLKAGMTLTIVPDGVVNRVPFAALIDQQTGRYLVEDHPIHVAPSATIFHQASNRLDHATPAKGASVLVLANPRLDEDEATNLPDLSSAESEARDIATLFTGATVLTGMWATKRAFLDMAPRYRIVHFAGHALANEQYSLLSRLLLARERTDKSGSLFAHEIMDMKLSATDLVVLAACRTGTGDIRKGEGPISLARPFLAVGVPSVIATLWDVDDAASRNLFGAFYKSLRQGAEPVVALRDAQLRLLRDPDLALQSPTAWGAFTSLGGVHSNGGQ